MIRDNQFFNPHRDRYLSLNWSDFDSLKQNQSYLTYFRRAMLRMIGDKMAVHPRRFDRPDQNYLPNACLIAMSDWESSYRFCACCAPGYDSSHGPNSWTNGSCMKHLFCPWCNWLYQRTLAYRYLTTYTVKDNLVLLTIALDTDICLNYPLEQNILPVLDHMNAAILSLRRCGLIAGAVSTQEIIIHFLPLRALPHLHAIADTQGLEPEDVKEALYKVGTSPVKGLKFSVNFESIASRTDFNAVLRYLRKTLDLSTAYDIAFTKAKGEDQIRDLNYEVIDLVMGVSEEFRNRHRTRACGTFHVASSQSRALRKADFGIVSSKVENIWAECLEEPLIRLLEDPDADLIE